MAAIEVHGLRKAYGPVEAVRGIDLVVEEGEVLAVLGPNGAGKTTTVEILEGYRTRDAGTVSVLGHDPGLGETALREQVGIVLQESAIDPFLSARDVLRMYGAWYPRPLDPDAVLDLVGLTEKADARVSTLSGGQRRRLDVALGLIGDPALLFLDEPTTGFDPTARRQTWGVIAGLRDLGKTILLTTHYMDEAQHLADRVVVVAGGLVVAEGAPDELGGDRRASTTIRFRLPPTLAVADLPLAPSNVVDDLVEVVVDDATRPLHDLTGWALQRGVVLEGLTVERPSLEDVYLQLTGGEADA